MKITKKLIEKIDIDISCYTGDLAPYLAKRVKDLYGVEITPGEVFLIYNIDNFDAQGLVDFC